MDETAEFSTIHSEINTNSKSDQINYSPNTETSVMDSNYTRRGLLGKALRLGVGAVVTAAVGKHIANERHGNNTEQVLNPPVPATQTAVAQETQVAAVEQTEQALPLLDRVNAVLGLELFSSDRNDAEMRFANDAATLEEVDLGLSVCAKVEVRQHLLATRARLRAEGQPGMVQLSEDQIAFCDRNKIDHEIFAMCIDAYPDALNIITKLQPDIRDDELGKTVDPEMLMINAGGMAQLVMQETTGFLEIGSEKAMTQLTGHDDINALTVYCQKLREDTGLRFDENNVPGSEHTLGTSTGGTIGIQFLPTNAMEHYNLLKQSGEVGNIFDPMTSIKMAWVFLASQKWIEEENDYQYGYMRGKPLIIDRALKTWNGDPNELQAIKNSADDAYDSGVVQNIPVS